MSTMVQGTDNKMWNVETMDLKKIIALMSHIYGLGLAEICTLQVSLFMSVLISATIIFTFYGRSAMDKACLISSGKTIKKLQCDGFNKGISFQLCFLQNIKEGLECNSVNSSICPDYLTYPDLGFLLNLIGNRQNCT